MKKTKISQKKPNVALFLIVCVVLLIAALLLMPYSKESEIPQTEREPLQQYSAAGLGITLDVPSNAIIDDRPNLLVLNYGEDEIIMDKIATDYETLEEYLENLSVKNHWKTVHQESIELAGIQWRLVTRKNGDTNKKMYFVKKNYWVYSFSTSSPALEPELKSILETFRFN